MGIKFVLAVDFGYPMDWHQRSSIEDLAECVCRRWREDTEAVVLAQDFIHDRLCRMRFPQERLIEVASGQSSTASTESGGSYHMLQQARAIMLSIERGQYYPGRQVPVELPRGLDQWPQMRAYVVAHKLHVGRVVKQGRLLRMTLVPTKELPTKLYPTAAQWWCRSKPGWYCREIIGYIPLKLAGQL